MGHLSRFIAPRVVTSLAGVQQALRGVQDALDRVSRSPYIIGLATADVALVCPGFQRVSAPAGAGSRATLPRASEQNAGDKITLCLEGMRGPLAVFAPPGQTINGLSQIVLTSDGIVELYSNGVDSWRSVMQLPTPTTAAPAVPMQLALFGSDGADGQDGMVGPPGQPGQIGVQGWPGLDGQDGVDGMLGPIGPPGIPGLQGFPGQDGIDGLDGEDGSPGAAGAAGATGATGATGASGSGSSGLPIFVEEDRDIDFPQMPQPTWASVLASGNRSGLQGPIIDPTAWIQFGQTAVPTTGDIRTSTAQWILKGTDLLIADITAPNSVRVHAGGVTIAADGAGDECLIQSATGVRVTGSAGAGFGGVKILESVTSGVVAVGAAYGMYWTRSDAPTLPFFIGDTEVVAPLQNSYVTQTTAAVVSALTTVLACTPTFTIPANTLRVGSRFAVEFTYQFVRGATATALNLNSFLQVGAVAINTATIAQTVAGTYQNRVWAEFTVLTTGAGGTCMANLYHNGPGSNAAEGTATRYAINLALACNTTGTLALFGAAQMNTAVAATSITATGGHVTQLA